MARKKRSKRKQIEWVHFGAAVMEAEVSVETGINHEISDRKHRWSGAPIYKFKKYLSVRAVVLWGEDQAGEEVWFHFYPMEEGRTKLTLHDLHLTNKKTGEHRYETYKGEKEPVYGDPDPIGYLQKSGKTAQGKQRWTGNSDLSPEALKDTMMLLLSSKQTYPHVVGKPARKRVDLNRVSISLGDSGDWEEFDKVQDQIKGQKLFL